MFTRKDTSNIQCSGAWHWESKTLQKKAKDTKKGHFLQGHKAGDNCGEGDQEEIGNTVWNKATVATVAEKNCGLIFHIGTFLDFLHRKVILFALQGDLSGLDVRDR